MPTRDFVFGRHAIIAPNQQARFEACKEALVADTRPGNFLEKLIVDELLHAQWELLRVEEAATSQKAEETAATEQAQIATTTRATRNWQRAGRELAALQTARVSTTALTNEDESVDTICADLTRIPARKPATRVIADWHFQQHMARATAEPARKKGHQ